MLDLGGWRRVPPPLRSTKVSSTGEVLEETVEPRLAVGGGRGSIQFNSHNLLAIKHFLLQY